MVRTVNGAVKMMTLTLASNGTPANHPLKYLSKRGRGHQHGFTLLELLLVLTVVVLASSLIIPNITGLEARTFNAQVRELTSLLNYARRNAVVAGQPSGVALVLDSEFDVSGLENQPQLAGVWRGDEVSLVYIDSTERETEIEERLDLEFFPEGGSTGGQLVFAMEAQRATIEIDPFTGRVELLLPED